MNLLCSLVQSTAHDSRLASSQKSAYIALTVLPSYLLAKLRDRMLSSSWSDEPLPRNWFSLIDPRRAFIRQSSRRSEEQEEGGRWGREWKRVIWEGLRVSEKVIALADLVNFLVFLYDGR
jgi:peroxin-2